MGRDWTGLTWLLLLLVAVGLSLLAARLRRQSVSKVFDLLVALFEVFHVLDVVLVLFALLLFLLLVVELADSILLLALFLFLRLLVGILQLVFFASFILELACSLAEDFVVVPFRVVENLVVRRLAQSLEQLLLDGLLQLSSLKSLRFSSFFALLNLCVRGDDFWSAIGIDQK